jgi:transcriptional regulator with PAS, ATPase and Fis domain
VHQLVFEAPAVKSAVETAKGIALKNVPVLLSGETGTGKEVLANIIHDASQRRGKFVPVNCAALPKELVEAELFGSVRGAYTGAHQDRVGLIKQADGGTLFLDELSELPNAMQAKLLRVLQDKKVRMVGQNSEQIIDFRLIVALNVDPHELIQRRKLRPDLFYRVNVVNIHLPPLRERLQDVLPLANVFLAYYARESGTEAPTLSAEVASKLLSHPWPGNVRQLQNEMMRLAALHEGVISTKDLSVEFSRSLAECQAAEVNGSLSSHEKALIAETLAKFGGNKALAAETLGVGRQTLYNKIRLYNLQGWVQDRPQRQKAQPLETRQLTEPERVQEAPKAEEPAPETKAGSNGDLDLF